MTRKLPFTKMHSCGNDYIFFRGENIDNPGNLAIQLTDRNKSIGGDGIVLVLESEKADARMRMFNSDGSEGLMCGSSIRCMAKFLFDHDICKKTKMKIETASGVKDVSYEFGTARADMGLPILSPAKIPVNLTGDAIVARKVNVGGINFEITCLSMGNPHAIVFQELSNFDAIAPLFEKSDLFPQGINLGVADMKSRDHIEMRVWERGTGETLASGTGAYAAAVAAVLLGYADCDQDITVVQQGGCLTIRYTDHAVFLTGDVATAYEGVVLI